MSSKHIMPSYFLMYVMSLEFAEVFLLRLMIILLCTLRFFVLHFKELKTAERETTPRNSSHRESLNESSGSLDLEKSFHPRFDLSVHIKFYLVLGI